MKSVAVFVHSSELGGAEQSTLTLLRHLDRSRWSPTLIHHAAPALAGMLEETARMGVPDLVVPEMQDGLLGVRRCAAFSGVLRDRGFDVFHAQLTWPLSAKFALAAAAAAGVRAVVATVHSYPEFTMTRTTAIQQRILGHAVGRYIAVSRDLAEKLHARMRWSRERIVVIYNATEVPSGQGTVDPRLRAELAGPEGRPVVLAMARLVHDKGLDVLVEAAVALPHAQFVIAGDGAARSALAAQVSELALDGRVKLLGWRTDIAALLAAADVFVLPSRNEALGVSALEAMAAGKPVIATAVGGVPEAVCDGETGLIVAPGDSQALAGAISALIADPARRERFGAAGRRRVQERFSTHAMATAVEGVYERLLDHPAAGRWRGRRTPQ
jgi:glycosyltransferase involved in cell wall biosynthesis